MPFLSDEWFAAASDRLPSGGPSRPGLDARVQFVANGSAGAVPWVQVIAEGAIVEWRPGTLDHPDVEVRMDLGVLWDWYRGELDGTAMLDDVSVAEAVSPSTFHRPAPVDLMEQPELAALPVIPGASIRVQYELSAGPWGPVSVGVEFVDGQTAEMRLGRLSEPDVVVHCTFMQMVRFRSGDMTMLDVLAEGGTVDGREGPLALLAGISESPEFAAAQRACGPSGRALAVLGEVVNDPAHVEALADLAPATSAPSGLPTAS